MLESPRKPLIFAALVGLLTACAAHGIATNEEAPIPARKEVSAEAVQRVIEGNLARSGNRRAEQLAALAAAVAADGGDAGLRMVYAEALFLSDKPDDARLELKVAGGLGAQPWERVLVEFPYLQRKGSVADPVALFANAPHDGAPERYFVQWRQVSARMDAAAERTACAAWTNTYPNQPGGWGCLGEVERREGNVGEAIAAFRTAAEAGSETSAAQLLELLGEQELTPELLQTAIGVAARFRSNIAVSVALAKLQDGPAGEGLAQACTTLDALAGQIGGNVRRYVDGLERARRSLRPEALACFVGAALETRGRNEAMVLASATAFDEAGCFERARPLLERVVEIDPSNAVALNQLGYSLAERNLDLTLAVGYLERAVRLRPEDGGILDSLAWAYFRQGRYAEAEPLSRKAIELTGSSAVLLDHLGDILWARGAKEQAVAQWRMAHRHATKDDEDVLSTVPEKLRQAGATLGEDPAEPGAGSSREVPAP